MELQILYSKSITHCVGYKNQKKIEENRRKSKKIEENRRKSKKIEENRRKSKKIEENQRKAKKIKENQRKSKKIKETASNMYVSTWRLWGPIFPNWAPKCPRLLQCRCLSRLDLLCCFVRSMLRDLLRPIRFTALPTSLLERLLVAHGYMAMC